MDEGNRSELEGSLRRVEALIAALDRIPDPAVREPARELLELVLELHTLGLARIAAIVAGSLGGAPLLDRLAEDPQVRAILLLHGLHPREAEARIRAAIDRLRPDWALRGIGVRLREVAGGTARLFATAGGNRPIDAAALPQKSKRRSSMKCPTLKTSSSRAWTSRNSPPPPRTGELPCRGRPCPGTGCRSCGVSCRRRRSSNTANSATPQSRRSTRT